MVVFTSCSQSATSDICCKRLTKWWYLQGQQWSGLIRRRCKRLTKWWYLQGDSTGRRRGRAVKGLQNGGICKLVIKPQ